MRCTNISGQISEAIECGNIAAVKGILKKNKLKKRIIWNSIYVACSVNNLDILKYLFQYGRRNKKKIFIDDEHKFIIDTFCSKGTYDTIKYILDYHGININLHYVLGQLKQVDIIKYVLDNCIANNYEIDIHNNDENIFFNACCNGNIDVMKYWIEYCKKKGSPINMYVRDEYIFKCTMAIGRVEPIKYLIDYCEKIDCRLDIIKYNEFMFYTFNHVRRIELFQYIIEYSEKINIRINIYMCENISSVILSRDIRFINISKYLMYLHKHNYNNYNMNIRNLILFKEYNEIFIKKYNNLIDNKCIYNNNIIPYGYSSINIIYNFNMNYLICL